MYYFVDKSSENSVEVFYRIHFAREPSVIVLIKMDVDTLLNESVVVSY